ncbi:MULTISPECIES: DUF4391 domain-containing protein [Shewanella]|uniref:DUF4391 domain-containing protein n=1 Tax=Shewanella TaxID=22 RepID=UPI001182F792|nr:DUF4391 domain-containing protein [Shewanella algae]MDL2196187.1 DUF4391 domain-containing protein [Shewanella algae]TVO84055.1 hypothetical protein AYI78_12425 [Shewanella algae]TVO95145.1 hypothetical protein AYI79_11940 [Shewanella algae]
MMAHPEQTKPFIPFQFPEAAALGVPDQYGKKQGQKIPKETIYQQASPTHAVKQLFVSQVEHITWRYKLSAETLNVAASEQVLEIQVFDIQLKANCDALDRQVLETLDKAIPSNIFYRIFNANERRPQLQCVMAYKRANKRDTDVMVVQDYFSSDWTTVPVVGSDSEATQKLPVVLNMAGLYTGLLRSLLPVPARPGEKIDEQLIRVSELSALNGKLTQLQGKQRKEKQFNRKVELNSQINQLKQQIRSLQDI